MLTAEPSQQTSAATLPHWNPLVRLTQLPAEQNLHCVHERAQVPQCDSLVFRLKHCPLQHVCPEAQTFAHVPHAASLVARSRHTPLQQVLPAAHAFPHVPQFASSVPVA